MSTVQQQRQSAGILLTIAHGTARAFHSGKPSGPIMDIRDLARSFGLEMRPLTHDPESIQANLIALCGDIGAEDARAAEARARRIPGVLRVNLGLALPS